ncbi:MerR family transcriptional regulator [Arthrobacter sp. EpRS71]|uniref:MerR family transcriptional regulator n=1 Tax=Arthrobacter sp. EpRS71 TaxID=1743141 RepID=UPI000A61A3E9|nr:MerR family transcriptional regulator [Arthrobacter sp. EpRS71]
MSKASGSMLRVGDLSALTGVAPRLLRYYEGRGLLLADRSPTGQRLFGPSAVERVQHIRSLLAAGLPTSVIRELIDCIYQPGRLEPCAVPTLMAHVEDYDNRIADLVSTRAALQGLIDSSTE